MNGNKACGGHDLRIVVGITMLALLLTGGADAVIITVNASGGGDYTRIQDAIDNAGAGDTILVYSGIYYENVNVTKQLNLRGIGNPKVNAGGSSCAITLSADGISLEGFSAINTGSLSFGGGIEVLSNNNVLKYNYALDNFYNGIYLLSSSSNNTLISNNASNNRKSGSSVGIHIYGSNNTLIGNNASNNSLYNIAVRGSNNNLTNNNANSSKWEGITLYGSNNLLIGNTLSFNPRAIWVVGSNNILNYNNVTYNENGIRLESSNTILSGNNINSNIYGGVSFYGSNDTFINNKVSNNGVGIDWCTANVIEKNTIYNNYFNNTNNFQPNCGYNSHKWNITMQTGPNIIGCPNLGGNLWAKPSGTGFSQTCTDTHKDGICDSPYILDVNNIDYLPLAASYVPSQIHGMKFNDSNGNGTKDMGESGISSAEIHLIRMIEPGFEYLAGTTFTNVSGNYNFTDLPPGYYRVEELPGELVQTFPANGMPHFIALNEGEIKTGINFGNQLILPSEIGGINFNDSNANGVIDDGETGISGTSICLSPTLRCNTTDNNGNYSFSDISPGNYTVYEYLSSEYVATTPTMVEVVVNSGEVKVINFGSRLPVPPPEDISVAQQSGEQNGVPTVLRPALTVLTISKNLTNISENVVSVNLTMNWSDGISMSASMAEINNTNVWTANFNAPFPGGIAQMRFEVDVSPVGQGPEDAIQIGDIIFIDPSGVIKNAYNGSLISGAIVTLLYEYPPETNNFIVSPPENQIPKDNPLITGTDGRYSWLTIPGTYRVRAEKAGYITAESKNVTVPPIVIDLNISLIPILPEIRFINGTIIDSLNKTSISGVKVSTNTSNSTTTNTSGFYSFAVTSGSYIINASFEPIYYKNSTTVSTAFSAVVVQDIELLKKSTGNISGSVSK